MLSKEVTNRIKKEAMNIARDNYADTKEKIVGHAEVIESALTAEAERAQGLVEALTLAKNELRAMYNKFGMFTYGPIIMNKIDEALSNHNNQK